MRCRLIHSCVHTVGAPVFEQEIFCRKINRAYFTYRILEEKELRDRRRGRRLRKGHFKIKRRKIAFKRILIKLQFVIIIKKILVI
jgi:hypothetical protein